MQVRQNYETILSCSNKSKSLSLSYFRDVMTSFKMNNLSTYQQRKKMKTECIYIYIRLIFNQINIQEEKNNQFSCFYLTVLIIVY
jgi:hypothetical protein